MDIFEMVGYQKNTLKTSVLLQWKIIGDVSTFTI